MNPKDNNNMNHMNKKKVTINENDNKKIIYNKEFNEVMVDENDEIENGDIGSNEVEHNNDFYFPWYVQAGNCAENTNLVRYTKVNNTGDCLFHSLIILTGLNLDSNELRNILKQSQTLQLCEKPNETFSILNTKSAWGNKDIIYIFSRDLDQNICVHIYDSKKNDKGEVNITYVHFKANESNNYIHLHLKASHYTPLLKIQEIDYYDIDSNTKELIRNLCPNDIPISPTIPDTSRQVISSEIRPRRKPPWPDDNANFSDP